MNEENRIEKPWGPWHTAGFGLLVLIVFIIGQTVATVAYLIAKILSDPKSDLRALAESAMEDGTLISLTILAGALAGCICAVLFAWVRSGDVTKSYLGFSGISPRVLLICLGATALFIAIADLTTYLLEKPVVPEFMASAYSTVAFKPLLWIAVCMAGPFFEELFFRGFLIRGWEKSRLGPVGTVILTSLIWTGIHLQYGLYELVQVFILGLMFGFIRVKTGSTTPAFACHVFANIVATIEAAVLVSRGI